MTQWLLVVFTGALTASTALGAAQPNVLIILADDLRADLGCYGSEHVVSPNLDRLAADGLSFDRAYCQKAVCWPSRNSFFSGLRPDSLGDADADQTFRVSHPDLVSLPQWFRQHGWFTRGFGKILHNGQTDPESWSVPQYFPEPRHYASPENAGKHPIINRASPANRINPLFEAADVPDDAYEDGLTAKAAQEAIREAAGEDQPFFFMVGFHKPHTPFNAPRRYWDLYRREEMPLSPVPDPPADVPSRYALLNWRYVRSFQGIPKQGPMPEDLARQTRHAYYACVSYVDALAGRLLDQLRRTGERDNTIVLFWSDHGYQLGDHSLWSKHTNFELATRVPLIISAPGAAANGQQTKSLVELLDIYPTLCELCGLNAPDHLQGRSFAHLLTNPRAAARPDALSEYSRAGARGLSVRTEHFRYTEWRSRKSGEVLARELYDHRADPLEDRNLADHPDAAATLAAHAQRLRDRLAE